MAVLYSGYWVGGSGQSTQGGTYLLKNGSGQTITLGANEYPTSISYTGSSWYVPDSRGSAISVALTDSSGANGHTIIPEAYYAQGSATIGNGSVSISNGTNLSGKTLALTIYAGYSASLENVLQVDITTNVRTYTITWKNGNTTLRTDYVEAGVTPVYSGATPVKASTAQYNYTFSGWSPAVGPAAADTVYSAQFSSTIRSYLITWKDYDGSTIATQYVDYGTVPSRTGPSRPSTAEYSYSFSGWNPSPSAVTGAATYTATYSATKRSYTVTWLQDDGTLIDTTTVEYGVVPTHSDPVKPPDPSYTYTFTGWSPTPSAVTGDATYTATYTTLSQHRTVKYYNGTGWVECFLNYYDGTSWVEVEPYYYDGNTWVPCSQT